MSKDTNKNILNSKKENRKKQQDTNKQDNSNRKIVREPKERKVNNLNLEARRREYIRDASLAKINIKRIMNLFVLVLLATILVTALYYFTNKRLKLIEANERSIREVEMGIERLKNNQNIDATLENLNNMNTVQDNFEKLRDGTVKKENEEKDKELQKEEQEQTQNQNNKEK